MSVPNLYKLEARRIKLDFYNAFLEEPLTVEGDKLLVPDKPGLGVKLDLDYLKAHEIDG
jgi:galactonate dehydratase